MTIISYLCSFIPKFYSSKTKTEQTEQYKSKSLVYKDNNYYKKYQLR